MRSIFITLLSVLTLVTAPVAMSQGQITRPSKPRTNAISTQKKSKAQNTPSNSLEVTNVRVVEEKIDITDDTVFVEVEQQAEFPGGIAALYKYLGEHLRYPEDAQKEHIEGRVTVRFVITKTGKVSDVVVIRGKHPSLDAEALRVVKSLPNFKPGMMNGQPVNVYYNLPISFRLQK